MRVIVFFLTIMTMMVFQSCDKEINLAHQETPAPNIQDSANIASPHINKKIKTSIKVHDDNVNGVYFRKVNRIQEAVHYFYNNENLLDSLVVLSDTTKKAKIIRTAKFKYLPDENKVSAYLFNQTNGYFYMDFTYDQDKKVLAISNKNLSKEMGVFYIYDGAMLSHKKYDFGKVAIASNLKYDHYNNLTRYEIYAQVEDYYKVDLEYDLTQKVSHTFDIKFNSVEIQFLYEGGVNILDLMGLHIGEGNTHLIKKRVESYLYDESKIRNTYQYQYNFDTWGRMTHRTLFLNEDTEIHYQYQY